MSSELLRPGLHEGKWFFFAHVGFLKILKIFYVSYDKIMYPVHKRTENGPEIAFYHFFKFQRPVL